jgi:hypothetical protein
MRPGYQLVADIVAKVANWTLWILITFAVSLHRTKAAAFH